VPVKGFRVRIPTFPPSFGRHCSRWATGLESQRWVTPRSSILLPSAILESANGRPRVFEARCPGSNPGSRTTPRSASGRLLRSERSHGSSNLPLGTKFWRPLRMVLNQLRILGCGKTQRFDSAGLRHIGGCYQHLSSFHDRLRPWRHVRPLRAAETRVSIEGPLAERALLLSQRYCLVSLGRFGLWPWTARPAKSAGQQGRSNQRRFGSVPEWPTREMPGTHSWPSHH
jgi:hypothetical protein